MRRSRGRGRAERRRRRRWGTPESGDARRLVRRLALRSPSLPRAQSNLRRLLSSRSPPRAGRRSVKKGAPKHRPENPLVERPRLPPRYGIRKRAVVDTPPSGRKRPCRRENRASKSCPILAPLRGAGSPSRRAISVKAAFRADACNDFVTRRRVRWFRGLSARRCSGGRVDGWPAKRYPPRS